MKKSNLTEASRWRSFILFAFVFCFAGTVWAAGPQQVADVQISPGQVTWKTFVDAEGWPLTISGQGIYLRELYEEQGNSLPAPCSARRGAIPRRQL